MRGLRLWSSLWFCVVLFCFFSLNLKQLSLLSLLLKTCFLVVEIVKLFRTHVSVCEHNPWTTKGRTGHGNVDVWQPCLLFCIIPSPQQGPVSFSHSSPCLLAITLHLQHLCSLSFLLPLLWLFLYPLCFLSLKDWPTFWWCAYFPSHHFPRT